MKITIEADAKEIAALVLELQKRREEPCEIEDASDLETAFASIMKSFQGKLTAIERGENADN